MKPKTTEILKRSLPLAGSWLFAVYPVLALYAHNVQEVLLRQMVLPLILSVVFSTLLFLCWRLLLRRSLAASLATILFLLLFWNYTLIFNALSGITGLEHWHLWPLLLVIVLHLVYLVTRIRQESTLLNFNLILFLPALLLIVMNCVTIIPAEIRKAGKPAVVNRISKPAEAGDNGKQLPDICIIILDECASLRTMKEEWGYDNSGFAGFLREKGFYVAENSQTRYNQTIWSITSLLNLEYVTGPVERSTFVKFANDADVVKGDDKNRFLSKIDFNDVMQRLNRNYLVDFLKSRGYRVEVLEGISQHQSSFKMEGADHTFSYQDVNTTRQDNYFSDAFYLELFKKTMLMPFDLFFRLNQTFSINYLGTRHILDYLEHDMARVKGPKLVYAHILCPHGPYVFNRGGAPIEPISPENQRVDGVVPPNNTVNDAYREQYMFICDAIRKVVNANFPAGSNAGPVMIIQSDHGPRPYEVYLKDRLNSFRVFNAVRFPDGDYRSLYDSIAPVNVMRVMMNRYFGGQYKMLEER